MSVSGNEDQTPDERLQDALIKFTGCVGESVEDICSYSLTIGETYVPFDPDEEDECEDAEGGAQCSQVWVRVMNVTAKDVSEQSFENGGCGATLVLALEVGINRCIEVPDGGEAPTASEVLVAAMQAMTDMRAIYCAAMTCGGEDWDGFASIDAGQWNPTGPLGGEYGGVWTFEVEFI